MKKWSALLLAGVLVAMLAMFGCGGSSSSAGDGKTSDKADAAQEAPAQEEAGAGSQESGRPSESSTAGIDFDGSAYTDMGPGTLVLNTPAGSSEEGNVPKVTLSSGIIATQFDCEVHEFENVPVTYTYIDGIEVGKGNYTNARYTINIVDSALDEGVHTVEVVQFVDDDPTGEVTVYKRAQYELAY